MAVDSLDVLKAELVLVGFPLLDRPGEFEAFRAQYPEARVSGNGVNIDVQSNVAEQGRMIGLDRDRITLELFPSKAVIRREYPSTESDLSRLAEISSQAINITAVRGKTLRAYGFNLDLVYSQDSGDATQKYLVARLVPEQLRKRSDWKAIGASTKLTYRSEGDQWQMLFEPRFGDPETHSVYLNVNLHRAESQLPKLQDIQDALNAIWHQAIQFAEFLDDQGG